jgi:hypothetical protein
MSFFIQEQASQHFVFYLRGVKNGEKYKSPSELYMLELIIMKTLQLRLVLQLANSFFHILVFHHTINWSPNISLTNEAFSKLWQACKERNETLAEILNSKENDELQQLALNATNNNCDNHYWFGLIHHRGYMWYNGTGSNVTYRNFGSFFFHNYYRYSCFLLCFFLVQPLASIFIIVIMTLQNYSAPI